MRGFSSTSSRERDKKRKRGKERELPHDLDVFLPESRLYSQLLHFQRRLDADLTRFNTRKDEMCHQAKTKETKQLQKILRVYVSNSHENQDNEEAQLEESPRWTLKIQGQILDPESMVAAKPPQLAFSNMVKRVVVQFEPDVMPDELSTVEWVKSFSPAVVDGFEIKRIGSQACEVKISVWLDSEPAEYKLSPPLAQLLDLQHATRPAAILALWKYIKANNLQTPSDPTEITPTEVLVELAATGVSDTTPPLSGSTPVSVFALWERLQQHLLAPDPYVFQYALRLDVPVSDTVAVYDIPMRCPEINRSSFYTQQDMAQLEIKNHSREIHKWKRKREFERAFSEAPVDVINYCIAAHCPKDQDEYRFAEYYTSSWVPDAVDRYLSERDAQKEAQSNTRMH